MLVLFSMLATATALVALAQDITGDWQGRHVEARAEGRIASDAAYLPG